MTLSRVGASGSTRAGVVGGIAFALTIASKGLAIAAVGAILLFAAVLASRDIKIRRWSALGATPEQYRLCRLP